jgi:hypothetical protein
MDTRDLERIAYRVKNIRARTWLILGGVVLVLLGLMAWAAIAVLSWLWAQGPQLAGTGWQVAEEAKARVEQVAPGLKGEAEKWLPATGWQLANEAMTRAEEVVPGVKEEAKRWLPGSIGALPEKDVSGSDPGPVARFPGLVRSQFFRDETKIETSYVGRADFDAVLTHYVQGFVANGFTQEVLAADAESERHQFVGGASGPFELRITRRPAGVVEVVVRQALSPTIPATQP